MPRIRNVLQQRAERRRKQEQNKQMLLEQNDPPPCNTHDDNDNDETEFSEKIIKSQIEPDGASSDSIYSLEEKPTRATMTETFSSGEENTAYSEDDHIIFTEHGRNLNFSQHDRNRLEDGGEFIDLAYESSQQENDPARGNIFVDLVHEATNNTYSGIDQSQYNSYDEEEDDITDPTMTQVEQPQTIEFVDSEDGKVFAITPRVDKIFHGIEEDHIGSLIGSNTMGNDECSKTLNTNLETLNYIPSLSEDESAQMDCLDSFQRDQHHCNNTRFRNLQVDIGEGESYEEDDQCVGVYDNDIHEEEENFIPQGNSELYDCDDGEVYFPDDALDNQARSFDFEEDGTFFEQLRSEHTRTTIDGLSQSELWQTVHPGHLQTTQQIGECLNTATGEQCLPDTLGPQLEDSYLSDHNSNSSWEEGSFGTGASRTMSRIDNDTMCDNDDDDDDGTYAGTLDGTDYYSDDDNTYADNDGDRPFIRVLKKFRDMNVGDQKSDNTSSDEEVDEDEYEDTKRRTKNKQKRRNRSSRSSDTIFERLGEIGIDILNETIVHAERANASPRRKRNVNQGGTIINTFADLFSCGSSSRY